MPTYLIAHFKGTFNIHLRGRIQTPKICRAQCFLDDIEACAVGIVLGHGKTGAVDRYRRA